MDTLIAQCRQLLDDLAVDLGAAYAAVELLPEGSPCEPIAVYQAPDMTADLIWLELPIREGALEFADLRLGFASGASRPRTKPWRIAQTLAELVVFVNQMRWQQTSLTTSQASRRILSVTEEELQRIILDVHDGPVQKLFAASSQVELLRARVVQLPEASRSSLEADLARVGDLLQASLGEIKTTLGTLRPPEFRRRPLVSVMQGLIMQHEALTGVGVTLEVNEPLPEVSLPAKIALYRILQEALSNAYRHAAVDHLDVRLSGDVDTVIMEVADSGRGFEPPPLEGPSATERAEHIGLRGMRDRALLVGGQFTLLSQPGHGTRIQVKVPGNV